jgi:hypothetical protein
LRLSSQTKGEFVNIAKISLKKDPPHQPCRDKPQLMRRAAQAAGQSYTNTQYTAPTKKNSGCCKTSKKVCNNSLYYLSTDQTWRDDKTNVWAARLTFVFLQYHV